MELDIRMARSLAAEADVLHAAVTACEPRPPWSPHVEIGIAFGL